MAKGQTRGEFDEFLKQERADAEEEANVRRIDPATPVDRAIAFIDAIQANVEGRESEIRTMKGSLRFFDWKRRTPELAARERL